MSTEETTNTVLRLSSGIKHVELTEGTSIKAQGADKQQLTGSASDRRVGRAFQSNAGGTPRHGRTLSLA